LPACANSKPSLKEVFVYWFVSLFFASTVASATGLSAGDSVLISSNRWTTVLKEISSLNNTFKVGEKCLVIRGERWQVESVSADGKIANLQYRARGQATGTRCPSGTLSQEPLKDLEGMTDAYYASIDEEEAEREVVEKILEKSDPARVTRRVADWTWVEVRNSRGIKNGNVTFEWGGKCGINERGILVKMGIDHESDRVLCRYVTSKTVFGTNCPTGTVFFVDQKYFEGLR